MTKTHYGGQHGRHDKRAATNGNSRRQHQAWASEAPSAHAGFVCPHISARGMVA